MHKSKLLEIDRSVLVIIDVQEAFRNAIPEFEILTARIAELVRGCVLLGVPIVVTEQYPRGLGSTAAEIRQVLPADVPVIEKTSFSSYGSAEFRSILEGLSYSQIAVCGIETHICVAQTVQELLTVGCPVHVVEDCVASRMPTDTEIGLRRLYSLGAIPTSVEIALFELMRNSKHPAFKEIQQLSKNRADAAEKGIARGVK